MRFVNDQIIPSTPTTGTTPVPSSPIDASYLISCSAQIVSTSGSNAGAFKLQASNDHPIPGIPPLNWFDIPGATATVSAGALAAIAKTDICYTWLRAVWTPTAGAGNITATLQAIGY